MLTFTDVHALREQVRTWRKAGKRVALVPTMGNLHDGHLRLVTQAARLADFVVVSVFVNPLQFGQGEDFDAYPRTLSDDTRELESLDVPAVLFAPTMSAMYPDGPDLATRITVDPLSDRLCGLARPGHFSGVATVVAKLFNQVQPHVALFGRKDYQQLMVIERMVRDLNMPVEVVGMPTVRESDGLAMSSRNRYLTPEERVRAGALNRALETVAARLQSGEVDYALLETIGEALLNSEGVSPEYFSIRRQGDLEPPAPGDDALVILVAARLGRARLIDNREVRLNRQH